jgi:hypothetical protein
MVIRLYGPFEKLGGKEIVFRFDGAMTLRALIRSLSETYEGFLPYAEKKTDAELSAQIAFVRAGRYLRLEDRVEDADTLDVLLPVTGG